MSMPVDHGCDEDRSTDALARSQGVRPIASLLELNGLAHPELWQSDEDYEEFLRDLYASRRAGVA